MMIDIFKRKPIQFRVVEVAEFEILRNQSDAVALDVRTNEEIISGQIGEPLNLNYFSGNFSKSLALLDRSKTYLVYCRNGGRARKTCKMMTELNFANVIMLKGGYKAWQKGAVE
ncbi:MAG: rhodanese-like domain-containing protein [Bacteroidota bacterium]